MTHLVVRRLVKAEQLGLFGRRPMTMPGITHRELRPVAGHERHLPTGVVLVQPHLRHVDVAQLQVPHYDPHVGAPPPASEPAPEAAPAETPVDTPADEPRTVEHAGLADLRRRLASIDDHVAAGRLTDAQAETERTALRAEIDRMTVAALPTVGKDAEIVSEPIVDKARRAPTEKELERRAEWEEEAEKREPAAYTYTKLDHAEIGYLPPGATVDGKVVTLPGPLHYADADALQLRPWSRGLSPAEQASNPTRPVTRSYFEVIDSRLGAFQDQLATLNKKLKRYTGLGEATATPVGRTTKKVAVGVIRDSEGRETGLRYADLPVTVMHVQGPEFKVPGGWRLRAKVEPLQPGLNTVTAVGNFDTALPAELWHSGMHCDHCRTDRGRKLLYGFQDPAGKWKRVGSACMHDFAGVSPEALAMAAGAVALLDNDAFEWGDEGGGSGWRSDFVPFEDVLALASAAVEHDGGYVTAKEAEGTGVMSTSHRVWSELQKPGKLTREVGANPYHRQLAQQVRDWIRTINPSSDYERNLATFNAAGAINTSARGAAGTAASAIQAYARHQEEKAADAAPPAGWFGKEGEKFGPDHKPKKNGKPGKHQHPPRLVRIVSTKAFDGQYGTTTLVTMKDDAGHTFKWWASGDKSAPTWRPAQAGELAQGSVHEISGGTIKKHDAYTPRRRDGTPGVTRNETVLTRADLTPVEVPGQAEWIAKKTRDATEDNARLRAGFERLHAKVLTELPEIKAKLREEEPELAEKRPWHFEQEASARWLRGLTREEQALLPDPPDDDVRGEYFDSIDATRLTKRLSDPYEAPPEIDQEAAERHARRTWETRQRRDTHRPIGALHRSELEAQPMQKAQQLGSVPAIPAQRVKFRHPDTGEEEVGHIHAAGHHGATIVDGRGQAHKVPHGDYMHDTDEPGEDEKPDGQLVAKAARKHLELGPKAPLAVYATAALLTIGGCKRAHELRVGDVEVKGQTALIHPDRLRTEDAAVVPMLAQLAKAGEGSDPLFKVDGEPMDEEGLTAYVHRFGRAGGKVGGRNKVPAQPMDPATTPVAQPGGKPAKPSPGAQPMAKAAASAYLPPELVDPTSTWEEPGGYRCTFRKGRSGIGSITIEGPTMPLPLHDFVTNAQVARHLAHQLVVELRSGRPPHRGVFRAIE